MGVDEDNGSKEVQVINVGAVKVYSAVVPDIFILLDLYFHNNYFMNDSNFHLISKRGGKRFKKGRKKLVNHFFLN